MPIFSTAKDFTICGTLALSISLGLKQNKSSRIPPAFANGLSVALTALGSWWLLRAMGNIKIGVARKLGTPLGSKDEGGLYKRRLGFLERWYVAHSRTGQHTGFMIALELETQPEHYPTLLDIRNILQRLTQRFPWLRVKVKRDGVNGIDSRESLQTTTTARKGDNKNSKEGVWGDDLYVEVQDGNSSINFFGLREVVLPEDAEYLEAFQKVLEEEGKMEWHDEDPDAPMWRATLLRHPKTDVGGAAKFSLVLAFHHLIMDGIGSTTIAQAILDESTSPNKDLNLSAVAQVLPPPMEDLMDTVPTLQHILLPVLLDRNPSLTPYFKPPHWQGTTTHTADGSSRHSQMVCCSMSLNGEQLKKTCQKWNVTVNSLCVGTLSKAIAKTIAGKAEHISSAMTVGKDSTTTVCFKVLVAKNERRSCNLLPSDHGAYLSGPQVYVTASSDDNPQEWQSIGTSFQRKLLSSLRGAAMDMGLCPFISEDWIHFAKKFARGEPNGINDSFEISNLGKVRLEEGCANWSVKNFWFAQGRKDTGEGMNVTMTRSGPFGEHINAVFSAFPQAIPRATLEQMAQAWEQEMQLAVS